MTLKKPSTPWQPSTLPVKEGLISDTQWSQVCDKFQINPDLHSYVEDILLQHAHFRESFQEMPKAYQTKNTLHSLAVLARRITKNLTHKDYKNPLLYDELVREVTKLNLSLKTRGNDVWGALVNVFSSKMDMPRMRTHQYLEKLSERLSGFQQALADQDFEKSISDVTAALVEFEDLLIQSQSHVQALHKGVDSADLDTLLGHLDLIWRQHRTISSKGLNRSTNSGKSVDFIQHILGFSKYKIAVSTIESGVQRLIRNSETASN